MTLTAGEWLALGIGLGGLATTVSIIALAELQRRADRRHRQQPR